MAVRLADLATHKRWAMLDTLLLRLRVTWIERTYIAAAARPASDG